MVNVLSEIFGDQIERILKMEVNLKAKPEEIFTDQFWIKFYNGLIYPTMLNQAMGKTIEEISESSINQAISLMEKTKKALK